MEKRRIGSLEVSMVGLGCNNFGRRVDAAGTARVIDACLDAGIDFLDTADIYGTGQSEEYLGQALQGRREQVVLATKCGIVRDPNDRSLRGLNGSPAYIRAACDGSLRRLGVDHVDLYQLHRADPKVPIEESVGAMADLVRTGKTHFIGLSEIGPETLRRAARVHPIATLQTEYSLLTRDVEAEVLPACRALGVGFLAYSPLGRGLLTGRYRSRADFAAGDFRLTNPRFAEGALEANVRLALAVADLARAKGCSPAQLALAWLLAQGEDIVPIPGTKSRTRLEENFGAVQVALTPADLARLDAAVPPGAAAGERYMPFARPRWE